MSEAWASSSCFQILNFWRTCSGLEKILRNRLSLSWPGKSMECSESKKSKECFLKNKSDKYSYQKHIGTGWKQSGVCVFVWLSVGLISAWNFFPVLKKSGTCHSNLWEQQLLQCHWALESSAVWWFSSTLKLVLNTASHCVHEASWRHQEHLLLGQTHFTNTLKLVSSHSMNVCPWIV